MGGGERAPVSEKVGQVLEAGEGHFDLASPPGRAEAGLPEGRSHVTYERTDKEPFFVRVTLPEGEELALDARMVGFDSLGATDPATGPPTTLDLHHYPGSLDDARDHLLAAAGRFGLDERAVTDWYERATGPGGGPGPPTIRSRWISTTLGYLRLQLRGSYRPAVDDAGTAQVLVHYALAWGGSGPAGPPSR